MRVVSVSPQGYASAPAAWLTGQMLFAPEPFTQPQRRNQLPSCIFRPHRPAGSNERIHFFVKRIHFFVKRAAVQGDLGENASDVLCRTCLAWGRDTCSSLLSNTGIASWGGVVMAPLFAIVVAMSLLLSQRIAAQKQALAQIVSECRQDVDMAYLALQQRGKITGITLEDLVSALVTMWDTQDADTQVCLALAVLPACLVLGGHSRWALVAATMWSMCVSELAGSTLRAKHRIRLAAPTSCFGSQILLKCGQHMQDEVRAFVDTAQKHGYKHFDKIVAPSPTACALSHLAAARWHLLLAAFASCDLAPSRLVTWLLYVFDMFPCCLEPCGLAPALPLLRLRPRLLLNSLLLWLLVWSPSNMEQMEAAAQHLCHCAAAKVVPEAAPAVLGAQEEVAVEMRGSKAASAARTRPSSVAKTAAAAVVGAAEIEAAAVTAVGALSCRRARTVVVF